MKALPITSTLIACLLSVPVTASAHDEPSAGKAQAQIAEARRATAALHDLNLAISLGYLPLADKDGLYCIDKPGQGAMGIHYLNGGLIDLVVDATAPEALLYRPLPNGSYKLMGAEYIVPKDAWDAAHPGRPPVLFGQTFHVLAVPNRYNVPALYTLHLWMWEHNRNGIFEDWNPSVSCP